MSWTFEIALRGDPASGDALGTWFAAHARPLFSALSGLKNLDLYIPAEGSSRDPYNNDGTGPLMLVMLDFASREALAAAVRTAGLARALGTLPSNVEATGAAFERLFYPVGGNVSAASLRAPFSYVVRYHRPADDEAAFIKNYIDTHPVTQAKLPGIRAIMCYLPLHDLSAVGVGNPNYMIGNEVVFDDIEAFNVAMASSVRQELRAHYHDFPRFTGANTHYAMTRTRLDA